MRLGACCFFSFCQLKLRPVLHAPDLLVLSLCPRFHQAAIDSGLADGSSGGQHWVLDPIDGTKASSHSAVERSVLTSPSTLSTAWRLLSPNLICKC